MTDVSRAMGRIFDRLVTFTKSLSFENYDKACV